MKTDEKKYYFMEDEKENERLASKVDPDQFVEKYLKPYLYDGISVLDVGSGPGVIGRAIGEFCSCDNIVALDIVSGRVVAAKQNMSGNTKSSATQGDAISLPFLSNSFDFVMARFLIEYVSNPELAIDEMVRVCKPGGRIFFQDLDGQILWHYPEDKELQLGLENIMNYLKLYKGFDPFAGRKLYHYAFSAGVSDIYVKAESYHFFPGKIDRKNYELWEMKFNNAMESATKILGSRNKALELKKHFLDYFSREDTLTYSVVFTVSGIKPKIFPDLALYGGDHNGTNGFEKEGTI